MGTEEGVERFLKDLREQCSSHNIKIKFARAKTVDVGGGIRTCGYYDADGRAIAVGKKNRHWLSVLVHESCHMDQHLEGSELWDRESVFGNNILDAWLLGKGVSHLRKAINRIQALELDCEKRAVKKIAFYDLPINTITYIQKANAYILYYNYVYETGVWRPATYDDPEVYLKFPSRFMSERYYRQKLSEKIRSIYINQ